ncbi:hypothetical protein UFOVP1616_21 [uncultured Caudovirales phage]|uniref:Transglycosylase SLT domain-containing protein n=1 Tax=uncultured Caudovirales phage TaxID=2100421 RepID=A0A6J5SL61_9CAUD|nr:hypothetical protein UFOVP1467_37 [uncultured Caudovirales phage]CAB4219640.1 hypothetical protein UFOVP1616_21 [uncultured Caudovirales phage]
MDVYQARRFRLYVVLTAGFIFVGTALYSNEPAAVAVIQIAPAVTALELTGQQTARRLLTPQAFRCFNKLIQRESNWRPEADNKASSAAGVGQLLAGTYKNLGMRHSTDALAQTVAALAYIGRRYGSAGPCGAWKHWQEKHWY